MIFVDLLEVAPAKSPASTSTVFKPRSCASSAQPAPVAPPPMTHTSKDRPLMLDSVSSRLLVGSPVPNPCPPVETSHDYILQRGCQLGGADCSGKLVKVKGMRDTCGA